MKKWHFCRDRVKGKIEIFTFSGCWKSCKVAIAKPKCLCTSNFPPEQPRSSSFSQKKFLKIRKILLKIQYFCWDGVKGKIEILTYSGCGKICNVAIAKPKFLYTSNIQPQQRPSSSFSQKKVFENSLNTFEDIAFLPGQCKGEN